MFRILNLWYALAVFFQWFYPSDVSTSVGHTLKTYAEFQYSINAIMDSYCFSPTIFEGFSEGLTFNRLKRRVMFFFCFISLMLILLLLSSSWNVYETNMNLISMRNRATNKSHICADTQLLDHSSWYQEPPCKMILEQFEMVWNVSTLYFVLNSHLPLLNTFVRWLLDHIGYQKWFRLANLPNKAFCCWISL